MLKTNFTILFLTVNSIFCQNLVLNPSFEEYYDCPKGISFFHQNVKNWSIPNNGTTDYFNSCSDKIGFDNFIGNQFPKTGNAYCGIYVYDNRNYREYIQGELSSPLVRGQVYEISIYVSLAEKSSHAIKNFQILFLPTPYTSYTNDYINIEKLSAERLLMGTMNLSDKEIITNTNEWVNLTSQYTASGFEKGFIIGNFHSDSRQDRLKISKQKGKTSSYYYIDDISIEALVKEVIKPIASKLDTSNVQFESDKIYTFKNVLFDFDKSHLLPVSIEELQNLFFHLKNNEDLIVEIYGHTDNVGTAERNEELSKERAKSVSDYLINQGIKSERIKWFGFGSSKPIVSNETEEGRAKNRRVEFKLISKNQP